MLGAMQDWDLRRHAPDRSRGARARRARASSPAGPTAARPAPTWAGIRRDALKMVQALRAAGHRQGRPHRHAGDEPQPPPGQLVRRGRGRRGAPHDQPAAVRRPARIHRQPRRRPRAALRRGVPADRRPDARASGPRSSTYICFDQHRRAASRSGSARTTAMPNGPRSTSAIRACCATPAAPPAIPRACSTSTARRCSTR